MAATVAVAGAAVKAARIRTRVLRENSRVVTIRQAMILHHLNHVVLADEFFSFFRGSCRIAHVKTPLTLSAAGSGLMTLTRRILLGRRGLLARDGTFLHI